MRKNLGYWVAAVLLLTLPLMAAEPEPVKLPDLGESRLVLPWADFKDLLQKLLAKEPPPEEMEGVPLFTLSQANFSGELTNGTARLNGTLTIHVLKNRGWVNVHLFDEQVPLAAAALDGKPVALTVQNGAESLILEAKRGTHTLTVSFYAQVDNIEGPSAISFHVPEVPVATLDFTVPTRNLAFELQPQGFVESRPSPKGSAAFAVLPPGQSVTLSWGEKIEEKKGGQATKEATVATLVTLAEDSVKCISTISYRIRGGTARAFEFLLPADVSVTTVTGTGAPAQPPVPEDAAGGKKYHVLVNFDVKGSYQLSVSYERGRKETAGTEMLPVLSAGDAVRQVTQLGVAAPSQMEVSVDEAGAKELRPIDVEELPAEVTAVSGQPILFAFSSVKRDWVLPLKVITHPPSQVLAASIPAGRLDTLVTREGGLVTRATYQVTNSNLQFLRMKLPADSVLWSTFVSGRPVKPASDDHDAAVLIPLELSRGFGGQRPSFPVEVLYYTAGSKMCCGLGVLKFQAPELNVNANTISWVFHLPEDHYYLHTGGEFEVPVTGPPPPPPVALVPESGPQGLGFLGNVQANANQIGALGSVGQAQPAQPIVKTGISKGGEAQKRAVLQNAIQLDDLRVQAAEQQGMARGLLPINVNIDFTGITVPTSRQVIRAGPGGSFSVWYCRSWVMDLAHRAAQLFMVLAALIILTVAYNLSRWGEWRLTRLKIVVFAGSLLGLLLLFLAFNMWLPSPMKGFIAAAVLFLAYLLLARRRRSLAGRARS